MKRYKVRRGYEAKDVDEGTREPRLDTWLVLATPGWAGADSPGM